MKKLLFILCAGFLFSACDGINFSNDKKDITSPTVSAESTAIIVQPAIYTSAAYMLVYRKVVGVDGSDFNIAQIVREENSPSNMPVSFIDYYTDSAKEYVYYIKYKTSDGYLVSEDSDVINGAGTGEAEFTLAAGTEINATYKVLEEKLYITQADITAIPQDPTPAEFSLYLSVNNGVRSLLFEMDKNATDYYLNFKEKLPSNFRNVNLDVEKFNLVGQYYFPKFNNDLTVLYYVVYIRSKPVKVNISFDDPEVDSIIIHDNDSNDIFDYN